MSPYVANYVRRFPRLTSRQKVVLGYAFDQEELEILVDILEWVLTAPAAEHGTRQMSVKRYCLDDGPDANRRRRPSTVGTTSTSRSG